MFYNPFQAACEYIIASLDGSMAPIYSSLALSASGHNRELMSSTFLKEGNSIACSMTHAVEVSVNVGGCTEDNIITDHTDQVHDGSEVGVWTNRKSSNACI